MEEDERMESHAEAKEEKYLYQSRDSTSNRHKLGAMGAELIKTKEKIKRARDRATQSWLDSKPLTDELEKLKSDLESAKNRSPMSNVVISDLQSQLETISISIKQMKEEEMKAKMKTTEINLALEQTRDEMELIKIETNEERRARSKLKKDLRVKKQTLRTLQLTLRAVRIETEAFAASADEALEHIKRSEMDGPKIELTYEECEALTRRAIEESSLADWRVSASMEQKLAAEARRNSALRRLKELRSRNRSRRGMRDEKYANGDGNPTIIAEEEVQDRPAIMAETQEINNKQNALPAARARVRSGSTHRKPPGQFRRPANGDGNPTIIAEEEVQDRPAIMAETQEINNKQNALPAARARVRSGSTHRKPPGQFRRPTRDAKLEEKKKMKKQSIFQKIKGFLQRKFTRLFG